MLFRFVRKLRSDESGATAIEYGLIAALVSIAAITAMTNMGTALSNMFGNVETQLETAPGALGGGGTGGTT